MGAKCISASEYAKKNDANYQYVRVLCRTKKIKGARFVGREWQIPEDAVYPAKRREQK